MPDDIPPAAATPEPNLGGLEFKLDPNYHGAGIPPAPAEEKPSLNPVRFWMAALAVATIALALLATRQADKWKFSAAGSGHQDYWFPSDADRFYADVERNLRDSTNEVWVMSTVIGDRRLAALLGETAKRGVHVYVIVSGAEPNETLNEANQQYLASQSITCLLDPRERTALNTIVIDHSWGITAASSFNKPFAETTQFVTLLTKDEIARVDAIFKDRTQWCAYPKTNP